MREGPEIEEGYKRLASAQNEEARLTRALVRKNRLDGLLAEQEQAIAVEAQRLAARREQLAETSAELSARSDGVPALEKALSDLEPERERLGSIERRIAEDGVVERSLRGLLEGSEGLRRRYDYLQARQSEARTAIAIERGRLESEVGRIERLIEVDLRPQVERLDALLKERERLEGEAAELVSSEGRIDEGRANLQEMESRAAALNSENERLRQTMEDTRQKFDPAGRGGCGVSAVRAGAGGGRTRAPAGGVRGDGSDVGVVVSGKHERDERPRTAGARDDGGDTAHGIGVASESAGAS